MKIKQLLILFVVTVCGFSAMAVPVKVTMNDVSPIMTLSDIVSDKQVETGEAVGKTYAFDIPEGEYLLTAIATDSTTVNGTIVLNVHEQTEVQEFTILTNTAYVKNTNEDGTPWSISGGDYTIDFKVMTKEGYLQNVTLGDSETTGRKTILALNGNTLQIQYIPSETRKTEGYITSYISGTLTNNGDISGEIVIGEENKVTIPFDAELSIGMKFAHYIDFTIIEPKSVQINGDTKTYTYLLSPRQTYNYRTWRNGGITQAGIGVPTEFTEESYNAYNPKQVNHSPKSNNGYETGDIFVNINPQGHLKLNVGDSFYAHAMRTWELTNTQIDNYFMEPDFHYTVISLDGKPSTNVVEINNSDTHNSPWSEIKAVGKGTVIILVTYDAISLPSNWMGGGFWGAIWPENTGVYVVTVGEGTNNIIPNMVINEEYNQDTQKLSGKFVDAEHDVFYYLDTEEGANYTFTPEGVDKVTIAYPIIDENIVSYNGFSSEGVLKNSDGSYTILLKHGRNIVKLSDVNGNSTYQVLTAKSCHREISNVSRPDASDFKPGDEIKIQYSGLFHPANKLAGIYNMSAYVTYNGTPNGTSLILGSGQYTFGSAPDAQAVKFEIPLDYDVNANPELILNEGVIQVNGYGDPIGNHRNINRLTGRQANFTATAHKTYFGAIPEIRIPVTALRTYPIKINCNAPNAEITLIYTTRDTVLTPNENGEYVGYAGDYIVTASASGYRKYSGNFSIEPDAEGLQIFDIEMVEAPQAWDGKSKIEPLAKDGIFQISNGAELAWFAEYINNNGENQNAVLTSDIDLGDYDWTPIGTREINYLGSFDGQNHKVKGIYINNPNNYYLGLFGEVKGATLRGVSVYGAITGSYYTAGLVGYAYESSTIDRCANFVDVTGIDVGGIVCFAQGCVITNCFNAATISGSYAAGVVNLCQNDTVKNVFNIGEIIASDEGGAITSFASSSCISNAFATNEYAVVADGQTLVTEEQMHSGEIAYKLGEAFGQEIGVDEYPVLGGMKVIYDEATDTYSNQASGIENIASDSLDGAIYYNIEGIASEVPYNGFNIVLLPDGTSRKLYIK